MKLCINCSRRADWIIEHPVCAYCSRYDKPAIALVAFRNPTSGRVFAKGTLIPASDLAMIEPVQ
jgi:hypothetical protein